MQQTKIRTDHMQLSAFHLCVLCVPALYRHGVHSDITQYYATLVCLHINVCGPAL